jgi:hypothetical protein
MTRTAIKRKMQEEETKPNLDWVPENIRTGSLEPFSAE